MPDRPRQARRRRRHTRRAFQPPVSGTRPGASQPEAAVVVSKPPPGARAPASRETTPDYSYVTRDLKKFAILAGGFAIVLIVLSFIWG